MDRKLIVFYDRHLRLWTAYYVDADGYQQGNAGYGPTRDLAMADVS